MHETRFKDWKCEVEMDSFTHGEDVGLESASAS